MTPHDFCSPDFRSEPYWWDLTPRPIVPSQPLPDRTDVLIIGSGYTGLHCALQTALAGRDTTVIDAEDLGWGCSSRNGGQISGEIKPGYAALARRYGEGKALALIGEARHALDWLGAFIEQQALDCDYRQSGRFLAAHNPRQFRKLVAQAEQQIPGLEQNLQIVEKHDQAKEIDSEYYHGGLVIERHCGLDPAKYHQGLLQLVQASEARVIGHCAALGVEREPAGFRVATSLGTIRTRNLVVATNGYTGGVTPWQRRRIIPIGSYMLATEPMSPELADRLMPASRVFSDTRKIVVYFRRSPDGRRLLFGGRVSVFESDPVRSLPALRREMLRIFPQLEDLRISHTWMGFVGYSFDNLPHLGEQDGIHYAMGYCGSGICLASYFGNRIGLQLLGKPEGNSAFDEPRFQTRPLYRGKPWFLASAVRYYQLLDRLR
ncbi:MAG: NAD(P)/FAD-dependent oxidoreductase [Gammaproteobacteria bacterium]|jgi:glycine/D-amino acid oxidase-like deaminating enzyme|nr:FAD-dependent oxidoreductase [Gammaproteobacteria bacterium]